MTSSPSSTHSHIRTAARCLLEAANALEEALKGSRAVSQKLVTSTVKADLTAPLDLENSLDLLRSPEALICGKGLNDTELALATRDCRQRAHKLYTDLLLNLESRHARAAYRRYEAANRLDANGSATALEVMNELEDQARTVRSWLEEDFGVFGDVDNPCLPALREQLPLMLKGRGITPGPGSALDPEAV